MQYILQINFKELAKFCEIAEPDLYIINTTNKRQVQNNACQINLLTHFFSNIDYKIPKLKFKLFLRFINLIYATRANNSPTDILHQALYRL